jgi:hypothetical protein
VKVKGKDQKGNLKKTDYKNVYHDFVKFVVSHPHTVAMPDPKKNAATLLGIDSDKDGIRDDIQLWIDSKSTSPKINLALRQYAKAITATFINKDDKNLSILATLEALRANDCHGNLQLASGTSPQDIRKLHSELNAQFLNTRERIKANFQIEDNFHGQLIGEVPAETACDF